MNIQPSLAAELASRGVNFANEIVGAAQRHGIEPSLLAAVAAQETGVPGSNGGHNVIGDEGHGRGLFQIDDRWHSFATSAAAMNPAENADYAAGMIAGLLHRYGGDVHKALSAYNAGSPNATGTQTRWPDGRVLGYADSVLRHLGILGPAAPSGAACSAIDEARANVGDSLSSINVLGSLARAFPHLDKPARPRETITDYASLITQGE